MADASKIQTVLGLVDKRDLGRVLCHEHLSSDAFKMSPSFPKPESNIPFTLENSGWIRQNPYSHRSNLILHEDETLAAILEELVTFKELGGSTIIENSTVGLNRRNKDLLYLAKESGVNIIAGTGYYVTSTQEPATLKLREEEIANEMRRELVEGDSLGVKCGVIGELGCSWPMTDFEKTVIRAAATIQQEVSYPVIIHPGRNLQSPWEIMRYFKEAGGNASKCLMSHLERTILEPEDLVDYISTHASFGAFDLFGTEVSYYQLGPDIDFPNDAQRIRNIKLMEEEKLAHKILVAHDIHTKHRLVKYGGHGYSHIFRNAIPKMLERGITQDTIDRILIHNPVAFLC